MAGDFNIAPEETGGATAALEALCSYLKLTKYDKHPTGRRDNELLTDVSLHAPCSCLALRRLRPEHFGKETVSRTPLSES